jgi:nitric oxide synthase oxygenase domain/subunit
MTEVQDTIRRTGTYDLTYEELDYASTLAWRNSPRCPGRIQWKNLKLFDCRHLENLDEMFDAICNHIEYSTNGGNIKPAITVFPKRIPGDPVDKFRMWNKQLIAYAGHEQEDGSIKGDPAYKDFTKVYNAELIPDNSNPNIYFSFARDSGGQGQMVNMMFFQ